MPNILDAGHAGEKEEPRPRACPFRHCIVPGQIQGQLTFDDMPCLKETCALWHHAHHICTIPHIAVSLRGIARALEECATSKL